MPLDESDFKNYKSIEDYGKTVEGNTYYHALYLRAVNHPIRREILKAIHRLKTITKEKLLEILINQDLLHDEKTLDYNLDYLIKALCVEVKQNADGKSELALTLSGKVVEYLE